MADAMIFKPGDLPECCTETFVSKPRVTGCTCGMQKRQKLFLHSLPMCTNPLPDTGKGFCFCCEKHVSDLHI